MLPAHTSDLAPPARALELGELALEMKSAKVGLSACSHARAVEGAKASDSCQYLDCTMRSSLSSSGVLIALLLSLFLVINSEKSPME